MFAGSVMLSFIFGYKGSDKLTQSRQHFCLSYDPFGGVVLEECFLVNDDVIVSLESEICY